MNPKKLHQNLEAVHAKPFTICLSDGRQFNLPHTDYLMLANDGDQVILLEGGNALKVIDAEHITSIDFQLPKRAKGTEG
jgi:hypothetical protein